LYFVYFGYFVFYLFLIYFIFILFDRYTRNQIIGVVLVTIGIILVTFAERVQQIKTSLANSHTPTSASSSSSSLLFVGISLLFLALVLSSTLGFVQEWTYAKYGKHWEESLFWTHTLSLPFFAVMLGDLSDHLYLCNQSPLYIIFDGFSLPRLWLLLLVNVLTQYVCIMGVYMLTSTVGTLTCTMTITIRKFLSLVVSITYFQNPFTNTHWIGSSFVFFGTILYSMSAFSVSEQKKKD
jgi:UDP-xylose/UDP-N-acetylglucosamine transporter B4